MSEQPAEFYGSVQIMPESDPATDPLMTVRMQPPNTWLRRYDGATVRVVKLDETSAPWHVINRPGASGRRDLERMAHVEVRDWLVQHPLVWSVAYDRLAGKAVPPPASAPAAVLAGDMDVDAFKGGADGRQVIE